MVLELLSVRGDGGPDGDGQQALGPRRPKRESSVWDT